MEIIFGTSNDGKLTEAKQMLSSYGYTIQGLKDLNFTDDIEETGQTLVENAFIKVRTVHQLFGRNAFAEDTGLEVVGLNMMPGVITARYAGEQKDINANIDLLLKNLQNNVDRRARFRTVVALIYNEKEFTFEGEVWGKIALERLGTGGFGYDPVFIPDGYENSFGQLPSSVKNKLSHRSKALKKMSDFLIHLAK